MKRLYGKLFLIGFGFFGVSVIWTTYNIFVPLFLANRYHLSPALIGLFLTLDNIAAFLIQSPVGVWSDRLRSPIGRRMPFVLIGAPVTAFAFGALPMVSALPVFFACACMLVISMAFWRTPVMALMPDITPSRFRSQANGIINLMGGLGAVIASIGGSALYEVNTNYPFWFGSALVIVASALVLLLIKEPKVYLDAEKPPGLIPSLRELVKDQDKSAIYLLVAIFFWVLTTQQADTFLTLYATRHLGISEGDAGRLAGHLGVFFLLFAIPAGVLGGWIGRRKTITIGIISMALFIFLIAVLSRDVLTIFITRLPILGRIRVVNLFLMASGISWAFININALPMVVDLTSADRIGTYTGFYFLAYTLSSVVGPILNGWFILLAGHNYNMVMIVGPVALMISLFFLYRVKNGEPSPKGV